MCLISAGKLGTKTEVALPAFGVLAVPVLETVAAHGFLSHLLGLPRFGEPTPQIMRVDRSLIIYDAAAFDWTNLMATLKGASATQVAFCSLIHSIKKGGSFMVRTGVLSTKVILLVDDDSEVLLTTKRLLDEAGYTVVSTSDPNEASRMLRDSETPACFDLLLTDVFMPDITGPDLATTALRLRPKPQILFMSGDPAAIPSDLGNNGQLLPKPFTRGELLCRVERALLSPESERTDNMQRKASG